MKSVLPLALWNAGLAEATAWRVAAGLAALSVVGYYVLRFGELRRGALDDAVVPAFWGIVAVDWSFGVALLAVAAGVAPVGAPAVYLLDLFWNLFGMSSSFMRLMRPIWRPT